ncbi:MAG: DUF3575 domain-containing protein [Tenuifilaceae bacterium]|jgi:hypothetical protein|nr:DUF3575 domain-containing protein [Tenuifilaceae bacterium]
MKKAITIVLALVISMPLLAEKPDVSEEKNVLKVNTLSLIVGTGSVFYERKINDFTSGQLGVAYLNYKFDGTGFSGLILTPEVRFYAKQDAIDGFYIGPYIRYQNFGVTLKESTDHFGYTNFGGGVSLGRQWVTKSGFTMDLFFGGHYAKGNASAELQGESFSGDIFEGFRTRMGFALGFAF